MAQPLPSPESTDEDEPNADIARLGPPPTSFGITLPQYGEDQRGAERHLGSGRGGLRNDIAADYGEEGMPSEAQAWVSEAAAEIDIIRREEARMLEVLTIVVHPLEVEMVGNCEQQGGADQLQHSPAPPLWYLLEAEWFRQWSAFLQAGDERPGPIENGTLPACTLRREFRPAALPFPDRISLWILQASC